MKKTRVLVIGVDGATFDIILPLVKAGRMPNFEKLMGKGSHCELRSTLPILSPVAWTTFSTGVRPGKHGIFNFLARREEDYEIIPYSSKQRRIKPVWKVAGEAGRKVMVLNVPATFPPDPVNGIMIAGDPAPFFDARRVHPPEAYGKLEARFGGKFLKPAPPLRGERAFLDGLLGSVELWTEVTKQALEGGDWDLGVVVYTATDTVQHFFWSDLDPSHPLHDGKTAAGHGSAIHSVYEKIDWAAGELLKTAGGDADIVVLSDHGFGPLNRPVPLTNWLVDRGYLSYLPGRQDNRRGGILEAARFLLSRFGLIDGLPPIGMLKHVDWEKTRVYFLGVSGDLFVNLKGREPRGIVEPGAEYDDLVSRMAEELKGMRLPCGSAPVEKVFTGRDLYPGSPGAPDLLIQWARGFDVVKEGDPGNFLKGFRSRTGNQWSGTHLENGILILSGPSIRGSGLTGADIGDVAPTVYHLLGLPVPRMTDGKVLAGALTDESRRTLAYTDMPIAEDGFPGPAFTDEDSRKIAESLKNLGYIE